jgi:hypothetical protein
MAKRLMAALLCAAATFAAGGVATAQARTLKVGTAKALARQLAVKQERGRAVISFHIGKPRRVSATRFVFTYDDRTTSNVFCTARIVVDSTTSGRTTHVRAFFFGTKCIGVPTEVRRFEALTRQARRDLRLHTAATLDALDVVGRSIERCRSVTVPRSKRAKAQALFDIALVEALERPNDAALGNFATGLVNVEARFGALAGGAAGWADYIATVRSLPTVDDPCAAVKDWKRRGFTAASAPIDFVAYSSLSLRARRDRGAINNAAEFLASRGAFPGAVVGFTVDGMLLQQAARVGIVAAKGRAKALFG